MVCDEKSSYFNELSEVRRKRDSISVMSPLNRALSDEVLAQVAARISMTPTAELLFSSWPYAYGFLASSSEDSLRDFVTDLDAVLAATSARKQKSVGDFLALRANEKPGKWYGGLFEVWAKSTSLRLGVNPVLDHDLPNRRDNDISMLVGGRRVNFECTSFADDDEWLGVKERYYEDRRYDPNRILMRPGPYCPVNSKGPSPYYTTHRLYAKVYDKLTKNLDCAKSQFEVGTANILLLSFNGKERANDPAYGWMLDELFSDQPGQRPDPNSCVTDISLGGWIEHHATELIKQGTITTTWYCEHSSEIYRAPRRLSAILAFDGSKLSFARMNYHADPLSRMSHRDLADIESMFSSPASYLK